MPWARPNPLSQVGTDVTFDKEAGLWTVKSTDGKVVRGRVLVCADGSTSRLATQLGYCTEEPLVRLGAGKAGWVEAVTRHPGGLTARRAGRQRCHH